MAEHFAADFGACFAAEGERVPERGYGDGCVVSWADFEVFDCGVAEEGIVCEDIDVNVGNGGGVFSGVGDVDESLDGQAAGTCVGDREVVDLGLEVLVDRYFAAVTGTAAS